MPVVAAAVTGTWRRKNMAQKTEMKTFPENKRKTNEPTQRWRVRNNKKKYILYSDLSKR